MRVISQDGTMDVPYEVSSLNMVVGKYEDVVNAAIYCCNSFSTIRMAEYGSEEKAKKAMEELRYSYMCHNLANMGKTPPDGIDEKLTMGLSGVFQFPTEEELE